MTTRGNHTSTVADAQPHTQAVGLGSKVGFEDAFELFRREACALVAHADSGFVRGA